MVSAEQNKTLTIMLDKSKNVAKDKKNMRVWRVRKGPKLTTKSHEKEKAPVLFNCLM